jgi:hypothetical protein
MAKFAIIISYFTILLTVVFGVFVGHDLSVLIKIRSANDQYKKEIQNVMQTSFQDRLDIAHTMAAETWIPGLSDAVRGGTIDQLTVSVLCEGASDPFSYVLGRGDLLTINDLSDSTGNTYNCTKQP